MITVVKVLHSAYTIEENTVQSMLKRMINWDDFLLFGKTHVFLQTQLKQAIKMKFPGNKKYEKLHTFDQIELLHKEKFLTKDMHDNCMIINDLRNNFVHDLVNKEPKIQNLIDGMITPWIKDNSKLSSRQIYKDVSLNIIFEMRDAIRENRNTKDCNLRPIFELDW